MNKILKKGMTVLLSGVMIAPMMLSSVNPIHAQENVEVTEDEIVEESSDSQLTGGSSSYINNGWKKSGGKWYYYQNGKKVTGLRTISGSTYYFNSDGAMSQSRWQKISGNVYYFDADGHMATGWIKDVTGFWYYYDSQGLMLKGWQQIGGQWYYFRDNGTMATGECYCSDWKGGYAWYTFSSSGVWDGKPADYSEHGVG